MVNKQTKLLLTLLICGALASCGGGGGGSSGASNTGGGGGGSGGTPPPVAKAKLPVTISDASNEDWATIGVKILSLTLTKSDGSTTSVTLPSGTTTLNLV